MPSARELTDAIDRAVRRLDPADAVRVLDEIEQYCDAAAAAIREEHDDIEFE